MSKKEVNLTKIGDSLTKASVKQTPIKKEKVVDKKETKRKTVEYPKYWETHVFSEQIKGETFHGTWQGFIREAIAEKIKKSIDNV